MRPVLAFLVITLVACGEEAASDEPAAGPLTSLEDLTVEAVPVASDPASLGNVRAVAALDDALVTFGEKGAIAIAAGEPAYADESTKVWSSAAAVKAPDATGRWAIAVDGEGRLVRLREDGRLENVGPRFGLGANEKARAIATAPREIFAVAAERSVIVVDGAKNTTRRFETGPLEHLAVTENRLAGIAEGQVRVFQLSGPTATRWSFDGTGVLGAAFDADQRLVIVSKHDVRREHGLGFVRVYENEREELHGIAAAANLVWFGAGDHLVALESGGVRRAPRAKVEPNATLAASAKGDVYATGDRVVRVSMTPPDDALWNEEIAPIYASVCATCHAPSSPSGIDLSTAQSWAKRKAAIAKRTVETRTMPPAPTTLTAEQIDAVKRWLAR